MSNRDTPYLRQDESCNWDLTESTAAAALWRSRPLGRYTPWRGAGALRRRRAWTPPASGEMNHQHLQTHHRTVRLQSTDELVTGAGHFGYGVTQGPPDQTKRDGAGSWAIQMSVCIIHTKSLSFKFAKLWIRLFGIYLKALIFLC